MTSSAHTSVAGETDFWYFILYSCDVHAIYSVTLSADTSVAREIIFGIPYKMYVLYCVTLSADASVARETVFDISY